MNYLQKIILSSIILLMAVASYAQAPEAFHYQAVLRNASGSLITSQLVEMRFTIRNSTPTGAVQYQETKTITANQYGLVNHAVGTGTVVSGTFASVTWGSAIKYLQVEVNTGSGYVDLGAEKFQSVPYALHAKTAASLTGATTWTTSSANIYNANTGNVGVGTTIPNSQLHINGSTTAPALRVQVSGISKMVVNTNGGTSIGANVTIPPTNGLYVSGNTGLGTTTPSQKLHVNGNIVVNNRIYEPAGKYFQVLSNGGNGVNIAPHAANYGTLGTSTVYWDDSYVSEMYYMNQYTFSDKRVKKNIVPLTGTSALASVMKLQGVRYDIDTDKHPFYLNKKKDETGENIIGFIAQDLQKVLPEMVTLNEQSGYYTVKNYHQLFPILVEGMKEQQKEIETLKKQLAQKEESNITLQSRLEKIEAALGIDSQSNK